MNNAVELYEIGFEDLVSVIPPGASIAEGSSVKQSMLGKCPGKRKADGTWVGYAFTKEVVQPEQIAEWDANVGLLGNRFPALDVDSEWPALTQAVLKAAAKLLGPTVVRHSRDPRRLLVYQTSEPFGRIALEVTHEGQKHMIEWLGQGRQYLVDGLHPANVPYRWARESEQGHFIGDLWDFVPEELPVVTKETALGFLNTLKEAFEKKGIECEIVGDGRAKEEKSPPQDDLLAPSLEALAEVVEQIPNDFEERDDYVMVGCAIKAAGGDLDMFQEWAARWAGNENNPDGNDPEIVESDWQRMRPPFRVGWTWLQEQAAQHSDYVPAADDFDDLPDRGIDEFDAFAAAAIQAGGAAVRVGDERAVILGGAPEPEENFVDPALSDEQAVRFAVDKIQSNVLRVPALADKRQWFIWNGYMWEPDERDGIYHIVAKVFNDRGDTLLGQADGDVGRGERKALLAEAKRMQSNRIVSDVVTRLGWRGTVTRKIGEFDADPWILNTPGGPLRLDDNGITPLDKTSELLLSKSTKVAPARGKPEAWLKFLHESTSGDKELQRYLQKLLGYSLSGSVSEQILTFIWGPSHTGKSVFLSVVLHVFGTYGQNTDISTFMASRSDKVRAEEAALAGARLVTANETEEGRSWDETIVKAITAGDARTVRHLYGHPFTYTPSYQILITGNNEPTIRTVDGAMRRRLHVVPFTHVVPVEQRDPALADKLKEEAPQILKWMLEGYVMWRREGLEPPEAVLAKTSQYFSDEDLLTQWVEECCDVDSDHEETRQALYMSWQQWCHRGGYDPGTLKQFKRKLDRAPFTLPDCLVGDRRLRGNRGIRVKPAIAEGVDENGF